MMILDKISTPNDLHQLTLEQLIQLATEVRELIVETVSKNGGHLASSLGTVELTLALFSIFNFDRPNDPDQIVWDVGHQAYAHKILTGRRDQFHTLRQFHGISGFPRRAESTYDAFGVGHASTSISAALGLCLAKKLQHKIGRVFAVLGDGALTGGESYEALNHAGDLHANLIVILNDNEMSIAKNVGAVSETLSRFRINPRYQRAKRDLERLVRSVPGIGDQLWNTANTIKDGMRLALLPPGAIFEIIGFKYIGPIDGNDLSQLMEVFSLVKELDGPILIHVHTKKGRGYSPAEKSPENFHGVGKFNPETGEIFKKPCAKTFTQIFSETIIDCAGMHEDVCAITAAMPSGTGLTDFAKKFPERFFDVGIAEEHAVTLAAGLAAGGMHPVLAIYSTFLQRGFDQIIHDVCLQNLPVIFCIDRAGLVGEDGATHHGTFDLSFLREIPNMNVLAPKDGEELRRMIFAAVDRRAPVAIRYPKGSSDFGFRSEEPIHWGKSEIVFESEVESENQIAIFAIGSMVKNSIDAARILESEGFSATVINMRFLKPIDREMILQQASSIKKLVTVEENVLAGGLGSAVAEILDDAKLSRRILRIGIPDEFVTHGSRDQLLDLVGLTPEKIARRILDETAN
ncbi:MAG: 1-deoxy-D-xylulose-5-phosphate synthase [Selenomonadaceae bacterium]|nr:1-deoxy-D-xylulose-5-phosphate synthase [Selenomonadaceae bacterium]